MNPSVVGISVFACAFVGAMLGMWLRTRLHAHYLDAESRDTIKLGIGLVATLTALVLGLITASYNWLGLQRYTVAAPQPLTPGKATIRLDFAYDGGGPGKGGKATISVNGKQVATGRIERTQCCFFSADEGADVGADEGTPVTEAYKPPPSSSRGPSRASLSS